MISRLHISTFIALTVFVWLIALWIQGMPVLNASFLKPFSFVVGVITVVVTLFNRYCWAWKIFQGWYVKRPDLRGTWKVELRSSWIDPKTNKTIDPIYGYAVIRQSLTSMSLRLFTKESKSVLIVHGSPVEELDGHYWTDRGTKGGIKLSSRIKNICSTYEQCIGFYTDKSL